MTEPIEKILLYMPTWVGDIVMATPAARAIRRQYPNAHITMLVRPNAQAVVADGPWVDEVLTWKPGKGIGGLRDLISMAGRIRREWFDLVVLFPNSFRSAALVWMARVSQRVGYARDGRGWMLTDGLAPERDGRAFAKVSVVPYYNRLAEYLGCPDPGEDFELGVNAVDVETVRKRLQAWGIAERHPLVVICPGASFGPSKLWPPERYAEVGDRLVRERGAAVVIAFGPGEEELAQRVQAGMESESFLVDNPRGTLGELKALIRVSDLLLINDTGPRHFSKAFGRRVVTVFGSTFPEWTHTDYPLERIVRIDVDCGPCQLKVCPLDHRCMTGVTSGMVYDTSVALLDQQDDAGG